MTSMLHLPEPADTSNHDIGDIMDIMRQQQTGMLVNLHAAYLHALADLEQSVTLLISGLLIWWKPS